MNTNKMQLTIEKIAKETLGIDTLERRKSDGLDFGQLKPR